MFLSYFPYLLEYLYLYLPHHKYINTAELNEINHYLLEESHLRVPSSISFSRRHPTARRALSCFQRLDNPCKNAGVRVGFFSWLSERSIIQKVEVTEHSSGRSLRYLANGLTTQRYYSNHTLVLRHQLRLRQPSYTF